MKTLSTISAAAVLATMFAIPAWAGPVGMGRNASEAQANTAQTQVNPELIAQLQEASDQAVREGRTGNKNNPVFGQKSAQINDLIEPLENGQKVDSSEIDRPSTRCWPIAWSSERLQRWSFALPIRSKWRGKSNRSTK
jgi:hypothetical protein